MLTIKEVREEIYHLWMPAKSRGEPRPPRTRVTFSETGWMDVLSDPEIRQYMMPSEPEVALQTVLGAEIKIDRTLGYSNAEKFKVELLPES